MDNVVRHANHSLVDGDECITYKRRRNKKKKKNYLRFTDIIILIYIYLFFFSLYNNPFHELPFPSTVFPSSPQTPSRLRTGHEFFPHAPRDFMTIT